MTRADLIARKNAVRAELAEVVRRLAHERAALAALAGSPRRCAAQRIAALEARQEALMAEESRLRQAIDRAGSG